MASESELNEYFNHAANVIATAYHHATRDGSVAALGREAIKDVRNTMNEFFFSKGERGGEPAHRSIPSFTTLSRTGSRMRRHWAAAWRRESR